jgi:hypothetical protein
MSLHQLAHHVQSAGRGDDKVLVHMTPKEVGGLQALAMAHGGSLTINPETGLPEAGFLSSLLPMIAGAFLGPAGLGLKPLTAALTVGAVGTAATGSLGKGLMMGLGAYGGAGLGAGLSSMGTTAPTTTLAQAPTVSPEVAGVANTVPATATTAAGAPAQIFDITGTAKAAVNAPQLGSYNYIPGHNLDAASYVTTEAPVQSAFDKLGAGFKKVTSGGFQGLKDLYAASEAAAPYGGIASLGSTALSSYYDKQDKDKGPPKVDVGMIRPYTYERQQVPGAYDMGAPIYSATPGSSRERNYFTDKYTALTPYKAPGPEYAADGGLVALAVGGPVEAMSAMNAIGSNTMYPQSQYQTTMYSNPMVQRPMPTNVISQGVDTPVDTYTGEQTFASGGETTGEYRYSYDPRTMQYTQLAAPRYVNPKDGLLVGANAGSWAGPRLGPAMGKGAYEQTPANPAVTGGIAQPTIAPTMPAQPIYTPPPVPAYQTPEQQLGLESFYPMMEQRLAVLGAQGYADGGDVHNLGGYSDGGRLLKGPGDGVSDSIPAVIGERQPARLADGEFVIPARIVSELGNGSTEAGARKLYKMMDRVQHARKKTMGEKKVAVDSRAEKLLPA